MLHDSVERKNLMEKTSNKLADLSVAFAVEILNLVKYLKEQRETIICNQIGEAKVKPAVAACHGVVQRSRKSCAATRSRAERQVELMENNGHLRQNCKYGWFCTEQYRALFIWQMFF